MDTSRVKLLAESIRLMEYFGWTSCGSSDGVGYWEHGDYPMQQFADKEALALAREMCGVRLKAGIAPNRPSGRKVMLSDVRKRAHPKRPAVATIDT